MSERYHRAELELDLEKPEKVQDAVGPALQDSDRVNFGTEIKKDRLHIHIKADSLGSLRGSLNTASKLSKLGSRIIGDFDE